MKQLQILQQKQLLSQYQQQSLSVLSASQSELCEMILQWEAENPIFTAEWKMPYSASSADPADYHDPVCYVAARENRYEDLYLQLHCTKASLSLQKIAFFLIGSLDSRGYLDCSTKELARLTHIEEKEIFRALALVQSLDPPGTGARNLTESLLIQLRRSGNDTPAAVSIVKNYLPLVADRKFREISTLLNLPVEDIKTAIQNICKLNPYPFNGSCSEDTVYIVPDIEVILENGEPVISLTEYLPSLTLDGFYTENRQNTDLMNWAKKYAHDAQNIISAVHQRQITLLAVAQYLVNAQRSFFTHNIAPGALTQSDIAQDLGISLSTVSRALNEKYMLFQNRIFPMKALLTSKTAAGHSKEQVKSIIRSIIEQENGDTPLSDADIARQMSSRGFEVSRRTITKYRQSMGIRSYKDRLRMAN